MRTIAIKIFVRPQYQGRDQVEQQSNREEATLLEQDINLFLIEFGKIDVNGCLNALRKISVTTNQNSIIGVVEFYTNVESIKITPIEENKEGTT